MHATVPLQLVGQDVAAICGHIPTTVMLRAGKDPPPPREN
jgi:hypothetical protein